MKNILILAFVCTVLMACGSDKKKSSLELKGTFDENFAQFVGTYKVVGCNADQEQQGYCGYQTVELRLGADENNRRVLVMTARKEVDHGNGHREISELNRGLARENTEDAQCEISVGRQFCTLPQSPGAWGLIQLIRAGNIVTIDERSHHPVQGDFFVTLQLEAL